MSFDNFRVLLWKNWTLQKRRPISGVFQIVFPIIIVVLATWGRNAFGNEFGVLEITQPENFELRNFTACTYLNRNSDTLFPLESIHFAPDNQVYRALIEDAFKDFSYPIFGYPNSQELRNVVYAGDEQKVGIVLSSDLEVSN